MYFVTFVTKEYRHWFGKIVNCKIRYNSLGKYLFQSLRHIKDHFQTVEIPFFVIMPNHVHAVVFLKKKFIPVGQTSNKRDVKLGNIVGSIKSATSKWAHENGYDEFAWQERFYDRIIRNEEELTNITAYIEGNTANWEQDDYYIEQAP